MQSDERATHTAHCKGPDAMYLTVYYELVLIKKSYKCKLY